MESNPEVKPDRRSWFKKKRYIIPLGLATVLIIAGLSNNSSQPTETQGQVQGIQIQSQVPSIDNQLSPRPQQDTTTPDTIAPDNTSFDTILDQDNTSDNSDNLSNDNYYTNTNGDSIHSPAYNLDNPNEIPAGASAQCNDGTYSFSASRRGTCSHHGGVSVWY